MSKTMNIGIDHGYYAIKTRHFSFPAGIAEYSHEPYTLQNTLEFGGKFFVCGTGRQPILRNKMENDNYCKAVKGVKQYRSKSTKGNPGLSGIHLFRAFHPTVYLFLTCSRGSSRSVFWFAPADWQRRSWLDVHSWSSSIRCLRLL